MDAGQHINHFVIKRRLGRGGMAEVFLAEDTRLHRLVALKLLPQLQADDPVFKQRFLSEGRASAQLNHPNICTVHEIGEDQGRLYIAFEYI